MSNDGTPCPACQSTNTVETDPWGSILCAACGHSVDEPKPTTQAAQRPSGTCELLHP